MPSHCVPEDLILPAGTLHDVSERAVLVVCIRKRWCKMIADHLAD